MTEKLSYHYETRGRAENGRRWRIDAHGMADDVLVVIGDGNTPERFAIVAAHEAERYGGRKLVVPTFGAGTRVQNKVRLTVKGNVKKPGPEVSEVLWDGSDRVEAVSNYYLKRVQAQPRVKPIRR